MMARDVNYWLCFRSIYYDEKSVVISCKKEFYPFFSYYQVIMLFDKFDSSMLCKLLADRYLSDCFECCKDVRKCKLEIFVSNDKKHVFDKLVVSEVVTFRPYSDDFDEELPF